MNSKNQLNQQQLSSSLDHNSLATDTAATDILNLQSSDSNKMQFSSTGSDSSSNSASSNHSKEYFTIGNRFDPTGLSSLLNEAIPDDDDDDMLTIGLGNGTLGRSRNVGKMKQSTLGLPNKSFNTYTSHKDSSKNSKNSSSGVSGCGNMPLSAAIVNSSSNNSGSSARYSNYSSSHMANGGSIRSNKQQRTSFAFSMRTNLDQEL